MPNRKLQLKILYLSLLVFALPSYLIRFSVLGIPTTLLEILIYFGLIWSLFAFQDWKKIIFLPKIIKISLTLIMLGAIIGILVAPDKIKALGEFKGFILDPLILLGLMIAWANKENLSRITQWLVAGGIILSLIAIVQALSGIDTFDRRVLSIWQWDTYASPNFLSLYLAPLTILSLTFWSKGKYLALTLAPLIGAIILSGSRAGCLSISAGLIFFSMLHYGKNLQFKFRYWLIGMLVVACISLIFIVGRPDFTATPESGRIASSNNIRWDIWRITIREILPQNWLFGVGLGNFQHYFTNLTADRVNFPEYIAPQARTPHNLYLSFWLEGGIIMLGGLIGLIVYLFSHLKKGKKLIAQSAFFTILIYGLVDTPFFKNDLSVIFWVIIAIYVIQNQKKLAKV